MFQDKDNYYMAPELYQTIYLSHVCQDKRHFWVLFLESMKEMQFFVVNPVYNQKGQHNINLNSYYQSVIEEDEELAARFEGWQNTNFDNFISLNQCLKVLDARLQEYKARYRGATLAVLSSNLTAE